MKLRLLCCILAAACLALPAGGFCAASTSAAPAAVTAEIKQVDINTAAVEDLQSVSGIGPVLAKRIVEYRQKNGLYKSVDDLVNVSGIGPLSLEHLSPFLKVTPAK